MGINKRSLQIAALLSLFALNYCSPYLDKKTNSPVRTNHEAYTTIIKKKQHKKKSDKITLLVYRRSDIKYIRKKIQKAVYQQHKTYVFGKFLDSLEERIRELMPHTPARHFKNAKETIQYEIRIPDNFQVKEMEFWISIDKNKKKLCLHQNYKLEDLILLESSVAVGGKHKDYSTERQRLFPTPSGTYYIKRIIYRPWWYPPKWSYFKHPSKPGRDNPYGLWMCELCTNNFPAAYEFFPEGDTKIRIHSTNNPGSIYKGSSHGCIRIPPLKAEEFFRAILFYTPHLSPKTNKRGTIYPLKKSIPVYVYD